VKVRLSWRCDDCGEPIQNRGGYLTVAKGGTRWSIYHAACDPRREYSGDYWIDVEQVRTLEQLLSWNARLLKKEPWVLGTDWAQVIRRCGPAARKVEA
jgi:hypothetical protein